MMSSSTFKRHKSSPSRNNHRNFHFQRFWNSPPKPDLPTKETAETNLSRPIFAARWQNTPNHHHHHRHHHHRSHFYVTRKNVSLKSVRTEQKSKEGEKKLSPSFMIFSLSRRLPSRSAAKPPSSALLPPSFPLLFLTFFIMSHLSNGERWKVGKLWTKGSAVGGGEDAKTRTIEKIY